MENPTNIQYINTQQPDKTILNCFRNKYIAALVSLCLPFANMTNIAKITVVPLATALTSCINEPEQFDMSLTTCANAIDIEWKKLYIIQDWNTLLLQDENENKTKIAERKNKDNVKVQAHYEWKTDNLIGQEQSIGEWRIIIEISSEKDPERKLEWFITITDSTNFPQIIISDELYSQEFQIGQKINIRNYLTINDNTKFKSWIMYYPDGVVNPDWESNEPIDDLTNIVPKFKWKNTLEINFERKTKHNWDSINEPQLTILPINVVE